MRPASAAATPLLRAAAAALAAWAVVRATGLERGGRLAIPVSFTPYVPPLGIAVTAAAVRRGRPGSAAVAGASTAALAVAVLPRALRRDRCAGPAAGLPLRIGVANLLLGHASPEAVVALVCSERIDVLVTPELTPRAVTRLGVAGLGRLLPHHVLAPAAGGEGNGVWSRWALRPSGAAAGYPVGPHVAVQMPGAGDVEVVAAHPAPPKAVHVRSGEWAAGLRALPRPRPGRRWILAGDLNATLDHALLREVLAGGWTDAAAAVGAGLRPTWGPLAAGRAWPAVVAIDHVLVDDTVAVRSVAVRRLAGSDHRAIVAELVVPSSAVSVPAPR